MIHKYANRKITYSHTYKQHTEIHKHSFTDSHKEQRADYRPYRIPCTALPHRCKTHLNLLSSVLQNLRPSIWRIETRLAITPASIKGHEGDRFAGVVWAVLSGRAKAGRGERTILFTIAFLTVSLMHDSPLLRLGVARSVQFVMSA